jgi:GT2 family glycosyltransferase
LEAQTVQPDLVVVVDNASEEPIVIDRAAERGIRLVRSEKNLGVGGGHNLAVRAALEDHGADHVWLLEHDTFPEPGCLEALLAVRGSAPPPFVVVADTARNQYERARKRGRATDGDSLERFTFNGPLLDRQVFSEVGFVDERLFVGQEDWDFSRRVLAGGIPILHCGSGAVLHAHFGARRFVSYTSPLRLYYSSRNLQSLNRRTGVVGWISGLGRAGAKALWELVSPGRGPQYARARWWAFVDAARNRLGETDRHFR